MLLQSIVEQLDLELDRLHSLRNIVSALEQAPPVLEALPPSPVAAVEPTPPPVPQPVRRRLRAFGLTRAPKASTRRARAPELTPLRHAVPQGPVVVSPKQLERERQHRHHEPQEAVEPVPEVSFPALPDLEGQSRALASRWIAGSAPN